MMTTRHTHADHHKNERAKSKAKNADLEYDDSDEAEKDWVEIDDQSGVEPLTLTGGNYDVRITEAVADTYVGHSITVPSANLQRNNTVTVANPTPPTNVPDWWQGTPPTPYISAAGLPLLTKPNTYTPGGASGPVYPVPAPVETPAARGAFINAQDSLVAGGKPESSGSETSQSLTGTTSLTSGWPRPDGAGGSTTVSAYNRGTGPETYSEFANQNHASSLSKATNPALTSITPGSTVSGVGTTNVAATGTNFTPQSKIVVNGVVQTTTFTSATSLNAPTVTKKTSAGTWVVNVQTGGVVTAPQNWTFT